MRFFGFVMPTWTLKLPKGFQTDVEEVKLGCESSRDQVLSCGCCYGVHTCSFRPPKTFECPSGNGIFSSKLYMLQSYQTVRYYVDNWAWEFLGCLVKVPLVIWNSRYTLHSRYLIVLIADSHQHFIPKELGQKKYLCIVLLNGSGGLIHN